MGYIESLLILLVAFIVIGPKDFPRVMFQIGDWWRRMKMTGETVLERLEEIANDQNDG